MPRGFLIGRLFGTDIYCSPGFFLLIAAYFLLAGAGPGALFSVAIVISILVHEFGHVFAVKWFLKEESVVVLWGLGGLCIHRPTSSAGKQIGISLMGPAFGLVLGVVCFVVVLAADPEGTIVAAFLAMMVWINIAWTVVNLLPIVPLDGGQALRAALRAAMGAGRSARLMRTISIGTAALGTAAAFYLGYRFAALIGAFLIFENLSRPDGAYR